MTVAELIAKLSADVSPESQVTINVGGQQVEDFDVLVEEGAVVLRELENS